MLRLNFLPATFSAHQISGYVLPYKDHDGLRQLQDQYKGKYLLRRSGENIEVVPLVTNVTPIIDAKLETFSLISNPYLFNALLEDGVRRYLRVVRKLVYVPEYGRLRFRIQKESEDMVPTAIKNVFQKEPERAGVLNKLKFLHVFRRYYIDPAYIGHFKDDELPVHGIVVDVSTSWQIEASVKELVEMGINVTGCYVNSPNQAANDDEIGNKSLGRIGRVEGTTVYLIDNRDRETVSAAECYIEASLENVTRCLQGLYPKEQAARIMQSIRKEVHTVTGAVGQQDRILKIAAPLAQEAIPCAAGLSVSLSNELFTITNQQRVKQFVIAPPAYTLGYSKPPITSSIAAAIAKFGPFDQDSFSKVVPHILVIAPKSRQGVVEQFIRQWRDGIPNSSYSKGFKAQY